MPSITHELHDCGEFRIVAHAEYVIHSASGDGWHEPREEACAEIVDVTLFREGVRLVWDAPAGAPARKQTYSDPIPGEVPTWVFDVLNASDEVRDALAEAVADEESGLDPDDWRDQRIDRELMEDRL